MIIYAPELKAKVKKMHDEDGMTPSAIYHSIKQDPKPSITTIQRWCDPSKIERQKEWRAKNRAVRRKQDREREAERKWLSRNGKDKAPPKPIHSCRCETPLVTRSLHDEEPTCLFCGRRVESASGRPQQNTR